MNTTTKNVKKEKEKTLLSYINNRPALKMSEIVKAIGISDSTMSNFRSGRSSLSFSAVISLEKELVKYGFSPDKSFSELLPEEYIPVGERKPDKRGEYLVKGTKKGRKKLVVVLAKFNGEDFYSLDGVRPVSWRAVPY